MKVCYNKLWKLLIDKGMKKSQLRVAVGASKSTFAKLGKNENVTLPCFWYDKSTRNKSFLFL